MKILRWAGYALSLLKARPRGWFRLVYNTVLAKARVPGPLMLPVHITLEPTNACNLRCPVCETGNRTMERDNGLMDYDKYCAFIDEVAPHVQVLMFYFMGEPFLHKRAYDMIRYARDQGMYVETCTNGDFVDAERVIYSDINQISFQIGGLTQETHETYRVRGQLSRVMDNIAALLEARRKAPGSNVQIEVGFIVMRHNEHEVPAFLEWAKEAGIDKANVIDPCVRNVVEGHALLPEDRRYWFYDEEAFERGVLKPKKVPDNECTWVWNSVMVNWDGSVVPCCRDPHGHHVFGNVFEQPLKQIWNAEKMTAFRRSIVTNQGAIDICSLCSGFGVPLLARETPVHFEIDHLSVNAHSDDTQPQET